MSQYELTAFDMDGTLLNSRKEITPVTLEALKKAVNAGKSIALSTGRCRPELTDYTTLASRLAVRGATGPAPPRFRASFDAGSSRRPASLPEGAPSFEGALLPRRALSLEEGVSPSDGDCSEKPCTFRNAPALCA